MNNDLFKKIENELNFKLSEKNKKDIIQILNQNWIKEDDLFNICINMIHKTGSLNFISDPNERKKYIKIIKNEESKEPEWFSNLDENIKNQLKTCCKKIFSFCMGVLGVNYDIMKQLYYHYEKNKIPFWAQFTYFFHSCYKIYNKKFPTYLNEKFILECLNDENIYKNQCKKAAEQVISFYYKFDKNVNKIINDIGGEL